MLHNIKRFALAIVDVVWVYLIPFVVVINVLEIPLGYLLIAAAGALLLCVLAGILYAVLFSIRSVADTIKHRSTKAPP